MLTAETITDEQILALRSSLNWDDDEFDIIVCDIALGVISRARLGRKRFNRGDARKHCARILNAALSTAEQGRE